MKNQLKTVVLLGILSAGLVALGNAVAPQHLSMFVWIAVGMNVLSYLFSDRLVLAMHRAHEVSPAQAPSLHRMVEELAGRAGIPKPRVYLIPEAQPNAFATGRNPRHGVVAVTEGIVELLTERELRGVVAHELAHIKNRDILLSTIAAVLASLTTYLAQAAAYFGGGRDEEGRPTGGGLSSLLLLLVAPFAAMLVQLGISRSREYLADETGARISGDPQALASALLKLEHGAHAIPADLQPATASLFIVNPLAGGAVLRLFSTHPPIEERAARLMAMARRGRP